MRHQAGFSAGGIVLVNNAFGSSFIQRAHCLQHFALSQFVIFSANGRLSFADVGTSRTPVNAIAKACCLVLFVSLDLRLNISQLLPPNLLHHNYK